MATFIHTSRGLLNLDHVVLIKQGVAREAGENYVQLADGRVLSGIILDPVPVPAAVPVAPAPAITPQDQDMREITSLAESFWRTIDTAPKDGSKILLSKIVGHIDHPTAIWWVCQGQWSEKWGNWNDGVEPCGLSGPSHWMPVPRTMSHAATTPQDQDQPDEEPKTAVGRWDG